MVDFILALPQEICVELGQRTRTRRLLLNLSVQELAQRVGVSVGTIGNFERTGKCTLDSFVRILESLNAVSDLQPVLQTQSRSIEDMRQKAAARTRKKAYPVNRGGAS